VVKLRNYRQGEIIPVAAGVTGLQITAIDYEDLAIGQVVKRANNRARGSVTDNSENLP
jgi:hypothetical protein